MWSQLYVPELIYPNVLMDPKIYCNNLNTVKQATVGIGRSKRAFLKVVSNTK